MSLLIDVVNVFVDDEGAFGNPLGIVWASPGTRKREQEIAADLGFSETIFIDDVSGNRVTARIFTPAGGLPFAGHPTVGLATWLHRSGDDITEIAVPAGLVKVRVDGDQVFVTARAEWTPAFEIHELSSPTDVEAVDPAAFGEGKHYVWAWSDEAGGRVRARMFAPALGIAEDEATGSAAVRLTSQLGRDLVIAQGAGSRMRTHVREGGQIEVGGATSPARVIELA